MQKLLQTNVKLYQEDVQVFTLIPLLRTRTPTTVPDPLKADGDKSSP